MQRVPRIPAPWPAITRPGATTGEITARSEKGCPNSQVTSPEAGSTAIMPWAVLEKINSGRPPSAW
jgi:hypothetical protein